MIRIRPSIVLFGDSITQEAFGIDGGAGWASMLASAYTRRADVLNRGFSGYNTRHALDILPRVFQAGNSDSADDRILFCAVFLGANDSVLEGELQHVPLKEYQENIRDIVKNIRDCVDSPVCKTKKTPIILITPPPIDALRWNNFCSERGWGGKRDIEHTQQYASALKEVGKDIESCHVLDAFTLLGGAKTEEATNYLSDGLHFNSRGNVKFFSGLMDMIGTKLSDLAPMHDDDGEGKHGEKGGIPVEEKLWKEYFERT